MGCGVRRNARQTQVINWYGSVRIVYWGGAHQYSYGEAELAATGLYNGWWVARGGDEPGGAARRCLALHRVGRLAPGGRWGVGWVFVCELATVL